MLKVLTAALLGTAAMTTASTAQQSTTARQQGWKASQGAQQQGQTQQGQTQQGQTKQGQTQQGQMQQGQNQQAASQDACNDLIDRLRQMPIDDRPVSLRQARQYRESDNTAACNSALQTAGFSAGSGTGQITIRQAQPKVTFQRGQPEIVIQQARPTITIDMPPPQVTVNMPRPDVNVVAPDGRTQADVQSRAAMDPTVRFERAEPRVVVRQSQQQPRVDVRNEQGQQGQSGRQGEQQQAGTTATQQQRTAATGSGPMGHAMSVDRLLEYSVYDNTGELIGDVERVVRGAGGQIQLIVGSGGFLGMGEKQVAIPARTVRVSGDRLTTDTLTRDRVETKPEWNEAPGVNDLDDNQSVRIGTR